MNRRELILIPLVVGFRHKTGAADTADWQQTLQRSLTTQNALTLGHIIPPPTDAAWAEVDALLEAAPQAPAHPIDVADYLAGSVPQKYRQAWPEPNIANPTYANPLIVRLFLSTHTEPSGDTTPWCAAFVNWCMQRVSLTGTSSASSQSFAAWGKEVWKNDGKSQLSEARPGDIAIFRKQSDPAHGHVAFFKGVSLESAERIDVLGGNQLQQASTFQQHLIGTKSLRVNGDLQLISIRRAKDS